MHSRLTVYQCRNSWMSNRGVAIDGYDAKAVIAGRRRRWVVDSR